MSYKNIDFEDDCVEWVCHFGDDMRNRHIVDGFFKTAGGINDGCAYLIINNEVGMYMHQMMHKRLQI